MLPEEFTRRDYVKLTGSAATVSLAGLAGCLGGEETTESGGNGGSGDSNGAESNSDDTGSETVTVWSGVWEPDPTPNFTEYVQSNTTNTADFTEMRYDEIKQKYLTGASTGTPDVVEGNPSLKTAFVNADQIEPITDRIENLDHSDGYIGLDVMRHEGEIWGFPWMGNGRGFVYRSDILDKYGWDVPESWDEFINIASEITKNEDNMHGFTLTSKKGNGRIPQEFLSMLFQRVDDIFVKEDGEWKLNVTPEDLGVVLKAYYWDPFYKTDPPATNPDARGIGSLEHDIAYVNGNYAAVQSGPWIPGVAQNSGSVGDQGMENYRNSVPTHNPRIDGGEKGTFLEVQAIMMNSDSAHKDAAWEVQQTCAHPEAISRSLQDEPGNLPAHEDAEWTNPEQTDNPEWENFRDVFETGKSYGFWSVTKAFQPLQNITQQVMYDETDPMKAGEQLYEEWKSLEGNM